MIYICYIFLCNIIVELSRTRFRIDKYCICYSLAKAFRTHGLMFICHLILFTFPEAAHKKFLFEVEQEINVQLEDAESRIMAVQEVSIRFFMVLGYCNS